MSRFPAGALRRGMVIPAHPLALTPARKLDERRQRALTRYYLDAGAGGIAVGVHTTQFAIRRPSVGLYRPVLELAAETTAEWEALAIGLSVAAVAASEMAAQSYPADPISCPYGQHVEYGYDSYGNEVAFCVDDDPWSEEDGKRRR